MIFSRSLGDSVAPHDWKMANETPVFKRGSRHDPGNYRAASLTSHTGKLLESLIRDEWLDI